MAILVNSPVDVDLTTAVQCLPSYDLQTGCTIFILGICATHWPNMSVSETPSISDPESHTESEFESVTRSISMSPLESDSVSPEATPTSTAVETPTPSKVESPTGSAISSFASSPSSSISVLSSSDQGPASGGGQATSADIEPPLSVAGSGSSGVKAGGLGDGAAIGVGIVIGGVVVGVILTLLWCFLCRGKAGDKVGQREEEEEVKEAPVSASVKKAKREETAPPPLVEPEVQEGSDSSHELSDRHELSPAHELSDRHEPSSGAGEPEEKGAAQVFDESAKPRAASSGPKQEVPDAIHFEVSSQPEPEDPVQLSDSAKVEGARVVEQEAVEILCAVGSKSSSTVDFKETLWTRRGFKARFEPRDSSLWLSQESGFVEPGAKEFPFTVFFQPEDSKSIETTLIVSFGEFEVRTPIVASTGTAKRHRRRHHE
jgi:hypothetical protein